MIEASVKSNRHGLTSLLVEFATVGKTKDGKVYHHLWGADEITTLLQEHGLAKAEEEDTG